MLVSKREMTEVTLYIRASNKPTRPPGGGGLLILHSTWKTRRQTGITLLTIRRKSVEGTRRTTVGRNQVSCVVFYQCNIIFAFISGSIFMCMLNVYVNEVENKAHKKSLLLQP